MQTKIKNWLTSKTAWLMNKSWFQPIYLVVFPRVFTLWVGIIAFLNKKNIRDSPTKEQKKRFDKGEHVFTEITE